LEKKEKKLKPEEHYFKVDSKILNLPKEALSKKELLVYILHCRAVNPINKFMGCSVAGFTRAREVFNLSRTAYQKALDMLIIKNLLEIRPDIKTGIYREAVEVLNFPIYNLEGNTFNIDQNKEDNHRRRYKVTKYINIPSKIIDKGYLKGLKLQDIWAILWLYNNLDMSENLGVSHELVYAYNPGHKRGYNNYNNAPFGDGFHKSIYNKMCVEVVEPIEYIFSKDLNGFQGNNKAEAFNSLIERGLFAFVPILIEYDEEDEGIITVKNEIFKGLVGFERNTDSKNKYLLVEPKQNQKIVWIMRPTNPVINEDFSYYLNRINRQRVTQEEIYCDVDIRTYRSKKINYIKDEEFLYFLSENYEDIYNNIIEVIGEKQLENQIIYNNYDIEIEEVNAEIKKKKDLIEREKEAIKRMNNERGERHKTSDLKKQLDKELKDLLIKERQYKVDRLEYEKLPDKIITLIPDNIFLHYENYEIKAGIE
jgi:hypothetical protein